VYPLSKAIPLYTCYSLKGADGDLKSVSNDEDITTVRLEKDTRADLEVFLRSRLTYNDVVSVILETISKQFPEVREAVVSKLEQLNRNRSLRR